VRLSRDGSMRFDYIAKEGKRRQVTVTDRAVLPTVRALAGSGNGHGSLFCWERGDAWQPLRSGEVTSYIAEHAGGHFTAKEFRTWNATVLMALQLANAGPSAPGRGRRSVIAAGVREVAGWLGDTPAVARAAYIHPALISRYESDGRLPKHRCRETGRCRRDHAAGRLTRKLTNVSYTSDYDDRRDTRPDLRGEGTAVRTGQAGSSAA